jgi:hypothetical protein
MKFLISIAICLFFLTGAYGQEEDFSTRFYDSYENYREAALGKRRIKHAQLQPLIDRFASLEGFEVHKVGSSIEGRDLRLISLGRGKTDVFLWSQMHGDEPTATQAIFDILNFFASDAFQDEKQVILDSVRLHFLPMLNPDGAELFRRRNTLGIDINRDALRLQSPEGRTLKRVRDSLQAEFGFNLHDQSTYYNAERTDKPATISYLAPAYNYEKDINEVRANAMRVIAYMNGIIQKYAPGQVGKYNDDFEPRAFGDNIQKWGTSAILIESGGFPEDVEKQEIRKLNYTSILSAIYTIARGNYREISLQAYEAIPENDRKLFDLKIEKVNYPLLGQEYVIDIGIQRPEVDLEGHNSYWNSSRIIDMGDLSTYYGYETLQAGEYRLQPGKVYPEVLVNIEEVKKLDFWGLLGQGYTYIRLEKIPNDLIYSPFPLNLVSKSYKTPMEQFHVGDNPTFVLWKDSEPVYAVINGFLYHIPTKQGEGKNSMIFR